MFNLILDESIVFALLVCLISFESNPGTDLPCPADANWVSKVSRCLLIGLATFPTLALGKLRYGVKVTLGWTTRFLWGAEVFFQRPHLSEILLSACISAVLVGALAVRKLTRRSAGTPVKLTKQETPAPELRY